MLNGRFRIFSVVVMSTLLMVSFQNCGKAGFDGENEGDLNLSSSTSGYPFAFDAKVDQIAYSSCFGAGTTAKPGFFTIMAGAYATGGINITQEFNDYIRGKLKPVYPSTTITNTQIKQALGNSQENWEAFPQLALRSRTNVQQLRTPNAQVPTEGIDFVSVLGDMTDDRWMDPLVTKPVDSTSYFNLAPDGQRVLEGKITYNADEGVAQGMRNDLRSAGMLGLTFRVPAAEGDGSMARTPSYSDARRAYGRGYNFVFEPAISYYTSLYAASPKPHKNNPDNILTAITEVDLRNPGAASGATWTCSQSRRYMIVRSSDAATACPMDKFEYFTAGIPATAASGTAPAIAAMTAAQYRKEYEIVRRQLKAEYWDVSVRFRCAVPKEGSCYPTETLPNGNVAGIQYDQREACFQSLPDIPYTSPIPTKRCAQFVSICTRN